MNAPVEIKPVKTTCPYCGVGCGVLAEPDGGGGARISGDTQHPANFGRLCSKGSALGETLGLDARLLYPMLRTSKNGTHEQVTWDAALQRVVDAFQDTMQKHGPDSVAMYVSGQLLTEDYYVANKLMKGFIGTANIDTNSRLCMASSVAGHKRAFGSDTVPGCYEDLDTADLLVLVGSNAAWCHPVLYQRMQKNRRERGAKIVVIDPRATATTEECDLHLRIAPGTDTALFSGLLSHLVSSPALDRSFISEHTDGFSESLARARHIAPDVEAAARICGLAVADIATFFDWVAATLNTVTLYSQGVNQSAQGTDKVNAIINCHLATGRIGRPGMGPFSLTGQRNVMGGREAGGLANQLAAHMGFEAESIARVRRFWDAPHMAEREGLKAVDLFDEVANGRIKALWIMATNPAVSLPRADAVRRALTNLDFLAVSEVERSTDTITAGADVLLPAAAWGEKDGTVTNSERRISRQRTFLKPPGEAKPDWWAICEVARRLGFGPAFRFASPADIFREHAALSAFENEGTRDFDLGGFAKISAADYAQLSPVQWPRAAAAKTSRARLFADGKFFTPNGKARFLAVAPPALACHCDAHFPVLLNTGRVRDHWHTMSRTGRSPKLSAHIDEPFVQVHPSDAATYRLSDGGHARVTSLHGSATLKVVVTDDVLPGALFAPIHWNGETSSSARIGAVIYSTCDPYSGQPELKATPVAIAPQTFTTHGFLLSAGRPDLTTAAWWARVAVDGGTGFRLACDQASGDWPSLAQKLLGGAPDIVALDDRNRGVYRAAAFENGWLIGTVCLATTREALPPWTWMIAQLNASPAATGASRHAVLAAKAPGGSDAGRTVCACFGVGINPIVGALRSGEASCPASIGRALRAGTNCGSCLPELKRIVAATSATLEKV